jgi:hypothetical protein
MGRILAQQPFASFNAAPNTHSFCESPTKNPRRVLARLASRKLKNFFKDARLTNAIVILTAG